MTTIKSYTSVEQSKKLAEILSIESADMFHFIHEIDTVGFGYKKGTAEFYSKTEFEYIPCWSLVALLDVIPYNITFNKAVYRFKLVKYSDHWECYHENFGTVSTNIFKADNPIDVCYDMILKLHEINLL